MSDYLRPWRLFTFSVGLSLLIAGAFYYQISDWDVGVSVVMALSTYLTAPWCAAMLMRQQWRKLPVIAFWAWLSVDGVYWLWHTLASNEMLRADQWAASLTLYFLCGFIWILEPKALLRMLRAKLGR